MRRKILVALLAATLMVGAFTGCGNKMEGDGKVQAAMADAGNGSNLATETPKSVSGATTEPTAEPTPKTTAEPTAEPAPKATAEPTAEPTSKATAEPTAEPAPKATAEPTAEPAPKVTAEPTAEPATTAQATNAQTSNQQPVASTKTADTAESYTSEFLELLNADRRAAGLSEVSGGLASLEAQALKRAKEFSGELLIGGGASFESMASSVFLSSAYEAFKQTEDTYAQLMSENLESVSLGRFGNMWALEGVVGSTVTIIDANHPVPEGYTASEDPIANMTTEEAVDEGLLEQISSTDSTTTYITPGETTVYTPEEAAAMFGEDW